MGDCGPILFHAVNVAGASDLRQALASFRQAGCIYGWDGPLYEGRCIDGECAAAEVAGRYCGQPMPAAPQRLDAGADAGANGSTTDAGVECCAPDPAPSCGMAYGGAKLNGVCYRAIDGMPHPFDPAWRLVNDPYGCPRWSSVGARGGCCGAPAPAADGGTRVYSCYGDYGEPPHPIETDAGASREH